MSNNESLLQRRANQRKSKVNLTPLRVDMNPDLSGQREERGEQFTSTGVSKTRLIFEFITKTPALAFILLSLLLFFCVEISNLFIATATFRKSEQFPNLTSIETLISHGLPSSFNRTVELVKILGRILTHRRDRQEDFHTGIFSTEEQRNFEHFTEYSDSLTDFSENDGEQRG